ncbi:hypothetical protein EV658_10730 [Phaeovulum veldkampii DSM 11550]|nr:hypothetical protein EV658_10730 [Phaeovulum veldkampii DSM 11550]
MALAALVTAHPAMAQDAVGQVERQLRRLGYRDITRQRTLLGRVRITALNAKGKREIILNPGTGEILRDFFKPFSGASGASGGLLDGDTRAGSAKDDADDDTDDDDDDQGDDGGDDDGGDDDGGDDGGGDDDGGDDGGGDDD